MVDASDALVFAQIDGENAGRGRGGRDRVQRASLLWGKVGSGNLKNFQITTSPTACMDSLAAKEMPVGVSSAAWRHPTGGGKTVSFKLPTVIVCIVAALSAGTGSDLATAQ